MNSLKYISCILFLVVFAGCKGDSASDKIDGATRINGSTMGTYYAVTLSARDTEVTKLEIDKLLVEINDALSTYEPHSIISQFNDIGIMTLNPNKKLDKYFIDVFKRSRYFYELSNGTFDPTVLPLVNFWGFGSVNRPKAHEINRTELDSLKKFVSFSKIKVQDTEKDFTILRYMDGTMLDFSAIAKGYGVDVIAAYLSEKGIQNYLVDIGGELIAKGKNPSNKTWTIGISKPLEDASHTDIVHKVSLDNVAMASSGNYRNFYESNGQKFSHTINPRSGMPERSNLLGVSIVAHNAMDADAMATTCMVKGLESSKKWIEELEGVEACLIYNDADTLATFFSSGFSKYLTLN